MDSRTLNCAVPRRLAFALALTALGAWCFGASAPPARAVSLARTRTSVFYAPFDLPFSSVTATDVRRTGEKDRESLRQRAAHAGPIDDDTLVYRIEFHVVA